MSVQQAEESKCEKEIESDLLGQLSRVLPRYSTFQSRFEFGSHKTVVVGVIVIRKGANKWQARKLSSYLT